MLKPMEIQSVSIHTYKEAKFTAGFSKLSIWHHENEYKKGGKCISHWEWKGWTEYPDLM